VLAVCGVHLAFQVIDILSNKIWTVHARIDASARLLVFFRVVHRGHLYVVQLSIRIRH